MTAPSLSEEVFALETAAPDLAPWRAGNTGVAGFWSFAAAESGPHVVLVALIHGNELAGAIALERLLAAGLRPARGRLTLGFADLAAFDRFDPADPTASRFLDEDMNRVWDESVLGSKRCSVELDRARELRPLFETADVLLDLHSMLWPSEPLILCGPSVRGRRLAASLGTPELVVADHGHLGGRRLIDYAPFVDPRGSRTAVLAEAGQHWQRATADITLGAIAGLLRAQSMVDTHPALPPPSPPRPTRFAEVTEAVTAETARFRFFRPYVGGEVIAEANVLIAHDGERPVRTPHRKCLLVMPNLKPVRGQTAVRFARFL